MPIDALKDLAKIRPWGTVLLGTNVRCDGLGIGDETRRIACFSHIHDDHIDGFLDSLTQCHAVIASKPTMELLIGLKGKWLTSKSNLKGIEYGKPFPYGGEKVTLYDSNHILGSSQILVEDEAGHRILYSGDFNMPGADADNIRDVDLLVLDSTHGEPRYGKRSPAEEMIQELIMRVREEVERLQPVIIRSTRGKMQKLMHILRSEVRKTVPFVSLDVDRRLAEVYSTYDMPSGEIVVEESDDFQEILKRSEPYVRFYPFGPNLPCELNGVRSIRVGTPPEYSDQVTNMFSINLSDHASFDSIMQYVKHVNPKFVITDGSCRRAGYLTALTLASEIKKECPKVTEVIPQPIPRGIV
jgi:Cft2 family RNA processing exonuclease